MPSTIQTAFLLLMLGWTVAGVDQAAAPSAAACTLSIAPPPDAIIYEGSPIPLAWTLTNTAAGAIDTTAIALEADVGELGVSFQELPVAGQAPITFRPDSGVIMNGTHLAEPPLLQGAQLRHALILNRWCTAFPPGVHQLRWTQPVPVFAYADRQQIRGEFAGTITITVLPGPHPHAAQLAGDLYRAYLAASGKAARSEAAQQLSALLPPAMTPYMALILQGEDVQGGMAAADFLDRMQDDGDARALLASVYAGRNSAARDIALRHLESRGELLDAETLHAMLRGKGHRLRADALHHLARLAGTRTEAERRALIARGAVPLADLQALLSSPEDSQHELVRAALSSVAVGEPAAR